MLRKNIINFSICLYIVGACNNKNAWLHSFMKTIKGKRENVN